MPHLTARTLCILCALGLAGCGGGGGDAEGSTEPTEAETTGSETASADPDAIPSPPSPWEEMDHEARAGWMASEVMPRMGERFAEFDGERYADFSCATCHGPNAREEGFEMPSNSLPALPATGTDEQHAMVAQYGDMVRFMFQNVLPTMQTLLAAPDYDEETHEGFSCYACPPRAGDEGSTLIELSSDE